MCCPPPLWPQLIVWDVWRPDQIPRIPWDNLMLLSMFYIVFATPYVIAFDLDMKTLNSSNSSCWIAVLDLVICGIFLTDMLFNLKTAYMKKTKSAKIIFITNRVSIVMHYLAFWFWLDLVTSIPWEFVVNVNSGNRSRDVQAARMMRILRIWRLVMLIRLMKELSKQNTKNVFDYVAKVLGRNIYAMAKLGLVVVCLIHWAGCSFYWASSWTNFDENTWVYHQVRSELPSTKINFCSPGESFPWNGIRRLLRYSSLYSLHTESCPQLF